MAGIEEGNESDSFNPSFISFDQFKIDWDEKKGPNEKKINPLIEKYNNIRKEIKECEIRMELVSHYTPLGAAAMLLESAASEFFNQHTQLSDFAILFASLDEKSVNVATKMALASAIDASERKQILYEKVIALRKIADTALDEMIRVQPQFSSVSHEIVIHNLSTTNAKKVTDNFKCEFCFNEYAHGASVLRHIKHSHSKHFENAITKYYSIANMCGDPKILEAINLLKANCVGLDTYQVLMDENLMKLVNQYMNNKSKGAELVSPTPLKKQLIDIDQMETTELRNLPENYAANTMAPNLNKKQTEIFYNMVVDSVQMLDDELPLNVVGIKKVPGGEFEDTFLVAGVAFKQTFSDPGFEFQPKQIKNPKIALLNIELDLKSEKDNAEVHLDNDVEHQKVVFAEWTILYEKLETIYSSGAKIVLSILPIGDDASQYFADKDMICAGNISEEDIKRITITCGGSILTTVADLDDSVLGTCQHFEESQIGGDRYNLFKGCPQANTCTIIIRGETEQFLDDMEQSLHYAIMNVRRAKSRRNDVIDDVIHQGFLDYMEFMRTNKEHVTSSIVCDTKTDIKQEFLQCGRNEKKKKLIEILNDKVKEKKAMVFVETQRTADFVALFLCKNSIQATSIHGGCLQSQCETALSEFKLGVRKILVITNIAARGLDIVGVDFVINYDLPTSFEKYVNHVRKIGLMGNLCQSISFFDDEIDIPNAGKLVSWLTKSNADVPAFLQAMVSRFGFFKGDDFNAFPEEGSDLASREICLVDD